MYSQRYYKNGRIPLAEFDIWFKHHLRRMRETREEYAARHSVTPGMIDAICNDGEIPTRSMLAEMGLNYIHVDNNRGWFEDA